MEQTQSTHYTRDLHPLNLHPQSLNALAAHFSQFPQTQRELEVAAEGSLDSAWDAEDESSASHANTAGQGSGKRARNGPPPLLMRPFSSVSPSQAAASCAALAARIAEDAELAAVQGNRARLPVNEFRDEIMRQVAASQVVLIAGATGHGPVPSVRTHPPTTLHSRSQSRRLFNNRRGHSLPTPCLLSVVTDEKKRKVELVE